MLKNYSQDPQNIMLSEHEHYGPYGILKITTAAEASIDEDGISGQLSDIKNLSRIVEQELQNWKPGESFEIQDEYSKNAIYKLKFFLKGDGYDPAQDDKSICLNLL